MLLPNGVVITPDIRDAERLQGFEEDWTRPATAVARAGIRWSLVGNAVTVPVARWVGSRLAAPGRYDPARDHDLPKDGRWPASARSGSPARAVSIGPYPTWEARLPLARFLNHPGKPLSARATRGFLSRTERSTLRFPDGFLPRLRDHLGSIDASSEQLPVAAE